MAGLFDKAKDFANSEKGEGVTDGILQKAADAASKATGGKHDDQIEGARSEADKRIGTE